MERHRSRVSWKVVFGLAVPIGFTGVAMIGSPALGWLLMATSVGLVTWKGWPQIKAFAKNPLQMRTKAHPKRTAYRVVPPKAVTVSMPELFPRRYGASTGVVDVVDVVNHTGYRLFRAYLELLYGCEQEISGLSERVYTLAWETNRKPTLWLDKEDRGQLLIGEWIADSDNRRVFFAYTSLDELEHPSTLTVVNEERTSLTDTSGELFFKIKVLTEPALPQGPIERSYKLSWAEGIQEVGQS